MVLFKFAEFSPVAWQVFAAEWKPYTRKSDGKQGVKSKGGRISYDPAFMQKVLTAQAKSKKTGQRKGTRKATGSLPASSPVVPPYELGDTKKLVKSIGQLRRNMKEMRAGISMLEEDLQRNPDFRIGNVGGRLKSRLEDEKARLRVADAEQAGRGVPFTHTLEKARGGMVSSQQLLHEARIKSRRERNRLTDWRDRWTSAFAVIQRANEHSRTIGEGKEVRGNLQPVMPPSDTSQRLRDLEGQTNLVLKTKPHWFHPSTVKAMKNQLRELRWRYVRDTKKRRQATVNNQGSALDGARQLIGMIRGRPISTMRKFLRRQNALSERARYESFAWRQGKRGGQYWLPEGEPDVPANRLYGKAAQRAANRGPQRRPRTPPSERISVDEWRASQAKKPPVSKEEQAARDAEWKDAMERARQAGRPNRHRPDPTVRRTPRKTGSLKDSEQVVSDEYRGDPKQLVGTTAGELRQNIGNIQESIGALEAKRPDAKRKPWLKTTPQLRGLIRDEKARLNAARLAESRKGPDSLVGRNRGGLMSNYTQMLHEARIKNPKDRHALTDWRWEWGRKLSSLHQDVKQSLEGGENATNPKYAWSSFRRLQNNTEKAFRENPHWFHPGTVAGIREHLKKQGETLRFAARERRQEALDKAGPMESLRYGWDRLTGGSLKAKRKLLRRRNLLSERGKRFFTYAEIGRLPHGAFRTFANSRQRRKQRRAAERAAERAAAKAAESGAPMWQPYRNEKDGRQGAKSRGGRIIYGKRAQELLAAQSQGTQVAKPNLIQRQIRKITGRGRVDASTPAQVAAREKAILRVRRSAARQAVKKDQARDAKGKPVEPPEYTTLEKIGGEFPKVATAMIAGPTLFGPTVTELAKSPFTKPTEDPVAPFRLKKNLADLQREWVGDWIGGFHKKPEDRYLLQRLAKPVAAAVRRKLSRKARAARKAFVVAANEYDRLMGIYEKSGPAGLAKEVGLNPDNYEPDPGDDVPLKQRKLAYKALKKAVSQSRLKGRRVQAREAVRESTRWFRANRKKYGLFPAAVMQLAHFSLGTVPGALGGWADKFGQEMLKGVGLDFPISLEEIFKGLSKVTIGGTAEGIRRGGLWAGKQLGWMRPHHTFNRASENFSEGTYGIEAVMPQMVKDLLEQRARLNEILGLDPPKVDTADVVKLIVEQLPKDDELNIPEGKAMTEGRRTIFTGKPNRHFIRLSEMGRAWQAFAAKWEWYTPTKGKNKGKRGVRSSGGRVSYDPEFIQKVMGPQGRDVPPPGPEEMTGWEAARRATGPTVSRRPRRLYQPADDTTAWEAVRQRQAAATQQPDRGQRTPAQRQPPTPAEKKPPEEKPKRYTGVPTLQREHIQNTMKQLRLLTDVMKNRHHYYVNRDGELELKLGMSRSRVTDRNGNGWYYSRKVADRYAPPHEVRREMSRIESEIDFVERIGEVSKPQAARMRNAFKKAKAEYKKTLSAYRREHLWDRGGGLPFAWERLRGRGVSALRHRLRDLNLHSEGQKQFFTFTELNRLPKGAFQAFAYGGQWGQGRRGGRYWLPAGKQNTPENRLYGQEAEAAARAAQGGAEAKDQGRGKGPSISEAALKMPEAKQVTEGMNKFARMASEAFDNPKKAAKVAEAGTKSGQRAQRAAAYAIADATKRARESGELDNPQAKAALAGGIDRALADMKGPMKTLAKAGVLKAIEAKTPKEAQSAIRDTGRKVGALALKMGGAGLKMLGGLAKGAMQVTDWVTRKTWPGRALRHLPQAAAWGLGAVAITAAFAALPAVLGGALTAGLASGMMGLVGAGVGAVGGMIAGKVFRQVTRGDKDAPHARASYFGGLLGLGAGTVLGATGGIGVIPGLLLGMWLLKKTGLGSKAATRAKRELVLSMPWMELKSKAGPGWVVTEEDLKQRGIA